MYKVMLVDDEKLILQGLKNIINWSDLGQEVVHLAETGIEALEKFEHEPVDIVITDINMPGLTGLELIKSIKKLNKEVKFIILSGYDEFSYAKEAIKYGVENYILKPVNEDELEEALIEVGNKIKEKKRKENDIFDKNRKLMRFLQGSINEEELKKMKDILNISFDDENYTVSSILLNNRDFEQADTLINVIKENTNHGYELIFKFNGEIILINSWNKYKSEEEIKQYYINIRECLEKVIEEEAFISIGVTVDKIEKIKDSYDSLNNMKKYVLTYGYGVCICKDDITSMKEKKISFSKEIEVLNKLIMERDMEKIEIYISKIFDNKSLNQIGRAHV